MIFILITVILLACLYLFAKKHNHPSKRSVIVLDKNYMFCKLKQIWKQNPDEFKKLTGKNIKDEKNIINSIHITGIKTYNGTPLIEFTNLRGKWIVPLEGFNDNQLMQFLEIIYLE